MANLFGHSVRWELLILYVTETIASFLTALLILGWGASLAADRAILMASAIGLCSGVISGACGLYQPEALQRLGRLLLRALVAGAILLLLGLPLISVLSAGHIERYRVALLAGFAAAIVLTRLLLSVVARRGLMRQRAVMVHAGHASALGAGDAIAIGFGAEDEAVEVIATVRPGERLEEALAPERLRALRVRTVILADAVALDPDLRRRCRAAGVRVYDETEFRELRLARVETHRLRPGWLGEARAVRAGAAEVALHRAVDIAAGLVLLLLTLPLLLVTALAIKLDSPGPVFYRQERVGRGGRPFTLYKFRSMATDAERGGSPVWATRRDPRVTRIGRFIRLTRIDEIPQVLNVLRGDMAFVGPRPERPAFVEQLRRVIPHYEDRHVVKPGITGWAQVNFPYGASIEDARMKLSYDLYYVRRRSLFLDLLILVATVRGVLFQEGSR